MLGLVLLLILPIIANIPVKAAGEPVLQVMLKNYLGNTKEVSFIPEVDYSTNLGKVQLVAKQVYKLKIVNGNIVLFKGTSEIGQAATFEIRPEESNGPISINNRPYLGSFKFIIEAGNLRPINTIGLEDYLKGVVPAEMPALWHKEALKAQAITARTYAMGYPNRVIDDTQNYQVYGGYVWHERSTEAVQATEGQMLTYSGKAIGSAALFSSSNGGMTESNGNAWGSQPLPYLLIKADAFDPKAAWSFSLKKQQIDTEKLDLSQANSWWTSVKEVEQTAVVANIKTWLKANGYSGKEIKIAAVPALSLHAKTSGGRVSKSSMTIDFLIKEQDKAVLKRLEIKDAAASKVRAIVGLSLMKSYLVNKVDSTGDTITVSGAGYGHGIGMSQYGAKKAAETGKNYKEILAFYFDKTTLDTVYQVTSVEPEVKPDPAPVVKAPTPVGTPVSPTPGPVVGTVPAPAPVKPAPTPTKPVAKDTQAPIIKAVSTTFDAKTNKAKLSFNTNEAGKLTVYVKDQNGKILSYLLNGSQKPSGTQSVSWDVSKVNNGKYSFGIIVVDSSNNRGSALSAYTLNKPKPTPPKDTKAPSLKSIKTTFDTKKNEVKLSFTTNEKAKVTVQVKDQKGKVMTTLLTNSQRAAGTQSVIWKVAKVNNGKYSFAMMAVDASNNKGTTVSSYTLNKPKAAVKKLTGKVNATTLNIRSTTSTKSKIVGTVKKNNTVTVLQKTGKWYKIQYGKKTGYVYATYLSNVK